MTIVLLSVKVNKLSKRNEIFSKAQIQKDTSEFSHECLVINTALCVTILEEAGISCLG